MRRGWLVPAAALGAIVVGMATAAPRPAPATKSLPTPAPRPEADAFANNLLAILGQVADQYVRPVPTEDLAFAALSGLYEAARRPVPRDLRARIDKALRPVGPAPDAGPVRTAGVLLPSNQDLGQIVRAAFDEVVGLPELEGQKPLVVACQALVRSLDPHSVVVTATEALHVTGYNQTYEGVGAEVEEGAGRAVIRSVLPGSPAQRAGLRPGDVITEINGKPLHDIAPAELQGRFRLLPVEGPSVASKDGPFTITVCRERSKGLEDERHVSLTRERFSQETVFGIRRNEDGTWDHWLDRKERIGYVRVGPLAVGCAEQLRTALVRLRDDDAYGIVLDLRWCPGGFLRESSAAAELFLGPCEVATVQGREEKNVYRSADGSRVFEGPVVVLVNGATSGGGELIAAALKDHGRARIAGQRTRGKASVQTSLNIGEVGLKLTTGQFLRPSGKNLHRWPKSRVQDDWGVRPDADLELRLSAELSRQLEGWWVLQALRPGSSHEALPMDDPEADPQLQAAAAGLRKAK